MDKKILFGIVFLLIFLGMAAQMDPGSARAGSAAQAETGNNILQDLDFWMDQDERVHVRLQGQAGLNYITTGKDSQRMQVVLPGASAPEHMVRLYRLDEFEAPLKSLLVQNTDQGAKLTWLWEHELGFEVHNPEEAITFRFSPEEAPSDDLDAPGTDPDQMTPLTAEQDPLDQRSLFPGMQEEYTGEPISIDLQNAEVEHVLRLILAVTDYNLILDEDVEGRLSLDLEQVPWDQALDMVVAQKDLGMVREHNIIRITTAEKLERERERARRAREAELEERRSRQELEPLHQEFIQVNYAKAGELQPRIQEFLSDRGRVDHDQRTNTLIIRDVPAQLQEIRELVDNLDRPERQVLIEARVVYATESFRRELGVDWQFAYESPGMDTDIIQPDTFNFPGDMADQQLGVGILGSEGRSFSVLETELRLGEAQGKSNTISSPQIMTLNNQQAEIEQGTRIRRQVEDERGTRTEYDDATLQLVVEPQITPDDNLILYLEVQDDSPAEAGIDTKTARTTLFVEDGETAVIGGIKQMQEQERRDQVPGFSSIPVLGWLFKQEMVEESMDELLIFIRPKIQQ